MSYCDTSGPVLPPQVDSPEVLHLLQLMLGCVVLRSPGVQPLSREDTECPSQYLGENPQETAAQQPKNWKVGSHPSDHQWASGQCMVNLCKGPGAGDSDPAGSDEMNPGEAGSEEQH